MKAMVTNIIDKALHYLGSKKSPAFMVQIGAMDGISYDDLRAYVEVYNWSGLYVEPIPYYFNKMVKNKKDTDLFEQSAITEKNSLVEMVVIDKDAIERGEIHHSLAGMSALYPPKNGLKNEPDVVEKYGRLIKVNGITLETLFEKHQISTFDLFICDAEGADGRIFEQLDLDKYQPKIIRLEACNLEENELQKVKDKFTKYNYLYEHSGQNIDAVHIDFWKEFMTPTKEFTEAFPYASIFDEVLAHNILQINGDVSTWKSKFKNANVVGLSDTDKSSDNYTFSSLDIKKCNETFKNNQFDIIIDSSEAPSISQLHTLYNLFSKVNYGGYYVIENTTILTQFKEQLQSIIENSQYSNIGQSVVIRKMQGEYMDWTNFSAKEADVTIVTGLWNMGRNELSQGFSRSYEDYKEKFAKLLKTPSKMFIYVSNEDEEFVWKHRSKHNTVVKIMDVTEFEKWFEFFDKVQEIRKKPEWYSQADWLPYSPQSRLEYYNPVVMSKMFLLNNATLFNPFNTTNFFWIDGGITNTVHEGYFSHDNVFQNLPKLTKYLDRFIFLSYPYEGGSEIHGFERVAMAKYANTDYVKYVCRGGFFGGTKEAINVINGIYWSLLSDTINSGYMGTEESIFTILSYKHPELVYRFPLAGDGLVWPFFEALKNINEHLPKLPEKVKTYKDMKTNIYVLGFNSPHQFKMVCDAMKVGDPEMFSLTRKILINNSTDEKVFIEYDRLCEEYGFEEIHSDNIGICGGRQLAAEHFDESGADFYMFFEDDMLINDESMKDQVCRNGMRTYIPNLYQHIVNIMMKDKIDFLKIAYSEFYGDNGQQWSWYNVPQQVRTEVWPDYDILPQHGLDPNVPRTKFESIHTLHGVSYAKGQVYYSNWPMIVSREGNKKMFLDTKWARPYEQTWMSYMFQETIKGNIHPAVLLATAITHNRISHYKPGERREN